MFAAVYLSQGYLVKKEVVEGKALALRVLCSHSPTGITFLPQRYEVSPLYGFPTAHML